MASSPAAADSAARAAGISHPVHATRAGAVVIGAVALVAGLVAGIAEPARAQRVVPKIGTICPLGYVDTLNGKCSTLGLMNYTVQPTNGQACPSGWMNVGGGYCRKK